MARGGSSVGGNGCMLSARRILLLLWKNLLFRRRHYIVTAFEIILPTIMAIMLVYVRSQLGSEPVKNIDIVTTYPDNDEAMLAILEPYRCDNCTILYAPKNDLTESIILNYRERTCNATPTACGRPEFGREIHINGYPSEEALESAVLEASDYGANRMIPLLGVVFQSGFVKSDNGKFPPNNKFSYKIRQTHRFDDPDTNEIISWFQQPGPNDDNSKAYIDEGTLSVQSRLDKAIIEEVTGNNPTQTIHIQAFPYPPYIKVSEFNQIYFLLLPQFLILGFVFIIPAIVRPIVSEKETGIKELMKMMGLPNWMHWLGWMLNSMFMLAFTTTIVVIIFFIEYESGAGAFVQYGEATYWWFVIFIYAFSITSFCFFVSAFFEKPNIATFVGIVLFFVSYNALAQTIEMDYENLSLFEKMSTCLIPNMAFHLALKVMGAFEGTAVGAKWSNFAEPASSVDSLTVAHCLLMMVIDTFLYLFLAIYVESIMPKKFGVRKPWYYIFLPSTYFCGKKPISSENTEASIRRGANDGKPGFEREPIGLRAGIAIQNLKKVFGNGKIAVDNVSCKMYDGQITALLGHNGAGKTTTMSILTGMIAPTSGTGIINGYDINTDMDSIRANLGLCPQHNMLFDKLTVQEHLIFFGRLKGMSASDAHREMKELLQKLHLTEKRYVQSEALSGGQKRKLSLGMALIGGTKVVVLDEPTSGMDPEARRAIWDLLLNMRGERTILLTTHFMEEADILGDRIAIMSEGKLQCCGTPMFLKEFYGAGYNLKMTISPKSPVNRIVQTVQKYIPEAFLKSNQAPNSSEISINLPSGSETTAKFPPMFSELSELQENFNILTIGISLTTMDEVFVKVGELSEASHSNGSTNNNNVTKTPSPRPNLNRVVGIKFFIQQFWGLLLKRMIYTLRKYRMFFIQFALPLVLVIAALIISRGTLSNSDDRPPLKMDLSYYKDSKTIYYADTTNDAETLGQHYATAVQPSEVIKTNDNILDALVYTGTQDLGSYRTHYIVAAEFNQTTAKAMFSTIPNHAAPLAMNLLTNAILKSSNGESAGYSLEMTVHSLPELDSLDPALDTDPDYLTSNAILLGIMIPVGLAFVAASFLIFPVEERLCKAKQLQLMTGVSPLAYWLTSFLWDFCLTVVLVAIMVAFFPIIEKYEAFTNNGGAGVLFLLFCLYGFAAISFSYLMSLFVSTVAGGFTIVIILHLITGMVMSLVVYFVENGGNPSPVFEARVIGTFFPTFTLSTSLMKFTNIANENTRCNIIQQSTLDRICEPSFDLPGQLELVRQCCSNCLELGMGCFQPKPYLTWEHSVSDYNTKTVPGMGMDMMFLTILGIVYFALTQIVEYGLLRILFSRVIKSKNSAFQEQSQDDDVRAESQRVRSLISSDRAKEDALIASDICKSYGSLAAVSKLSFGVHHGECFGLLGVNGAGKTTTFRMLTGDEIPSSGNAFAHKYTLLNNRSYFLSNIGYCPQFDGIVGVLSGRQMLQLFCRLRGIPSESVDAEADRWLHKLGLYECGDVQCEKYSGGMKRRLSAAMALVGDLPLIMLDEPTSGVDPVARRQFWKVIESVRDSGQAVILTSHSMEECEALCSRLGIMVNGQFQCMGGVQHLKNKFGQGYSLLLKLRPLIPQDDPGINALNQEICTRFHPCVLKDRHQNVLKYQVYDTKMSWDILFKTMEDFKSIFGNILEDYSVSETSLEEVFLSFARKQYPDRTADVSACRKFITCQC